MSIQQFAGEVCNALEGKQVSYDLLTSDQIGVLSKDVEKQSFMTSLKLIVSKVSELDGALQIRLNRAVALKDVERRAIPVTGM